MSGYMRLKPVEKRQAILDYLNTHPEGVAYAEIKAALGTNDSLSTTLNVMLLRDEVGQASRSGNVVKWIALVQKTQEVGRGPEPEVARAKFPESRKSDLNPLQQKHCRVVRLLDKTGHSTGGQCAGNQHGSLQCGFQERGLRV